VLLEAEGVTLREDLSVVAWVSSNQTNPLEPTRAIRSTAEPVPHQNRHLMRSGMGECFELAVYSMWPIIEPNPPVSDPRSTLNYIHETSIYSVNNEHLPNYSCTKYEYFSYAFKSQTTPTKYRNISPSFVKNSFNHSCHMRINIIYVRNTKWL